LNHLNPKHKAIGNRERHFWALRTRVRSFQRIPLEARVLQVTLGFNPRINASAKTVNIEMQELKQDALRRWSTVREFNAPSKTHAARGGIELGNRRDCHPIPHG
jgi:hypothetical protein